MRCSDSKVTCRPNAQIVEIPIHEWREYMSCMCTMSWYLNTARTPTAPNMKAMRLRNMCTFFCTFLSPTTVLYAISAAKIHSFHMIVRGRDIEVGPNDENWGLRQKKKKRTLIALLYGASIYIYIPSPLKRIKPKTMRKGWTCRERRRNYELTTVPIR